MDNENMDSPSNDLSARIKFCDVSKRLEKIYKAKNPKDKADIMKRFINAIEELRTKFFAEMGSSANASIYPILRLFLPKSDTERDSYGIRTTTLGKLYIKALAIHSDSLVAKKLTAQQGMTNNCVDFGDIVYEVMTGRSPDKGTLTVYEVNKYLDLISEHFKQNERSKIDTEMVQMLHGMTALDRKWLTRIILKKLGLKLGHQRILQLYHPDALNHYNRYSHLSKVCELIESGEVLAEYPAIGLFQPIRPMLCERGYISQINRLLNENEYYLETKMDGEHFLVHINGKEFRYYSRHGNDDFTTTFGADSSGGVYSPMLYRLLNGKFQNAILDGEMMVWNREDEIYHTKADGFAARNLRRDDSNLCVCFCVFDIIYLNDVCLTDKPYAERSRLLRDLIGEKQGALTICERTKIRDVTHFLECLNKAYEANEEGVVIKQAESKYVPNKREKGGWLKFKPDYEANLVSDFDLLIIGGYYSARKKFISSFLLGVFKKNDENSDAGVFHAVTRISHGLKRQMYSQIQQKLAPHWNNVRTTKDGRTTISHNPSCIEWNNAVPDVWIEPKHSIILQVKATKIVETNTFRTSHSFQFPRVMAIRDDKMWYDCCTLNEFKQFCSNNCKLTKRHATVDDIGESSTRPMPKRGRKSEKLVRKPDNLGVLHKEIKIIDKVCAGLDFCILNTGKNKPTIDDLKNMILKHGGRVVANPSSKTFVCIADYKPLNVKMLIKSAKYNIATVDWLVNAFGGNAPLKRLPKLHPLEMIYSTMELQQKFSNDYDSYGDSYTQPVTENSIKNFLEKMNTTDVPTFTASELYDMEKKLSSTLEPANFFRLCTAYFNQTNDASNDFELSKFIFKSKSGRCLNSANEINESHSKLTHIFIDKDQFQWKHLIALQLVPDIELNDIKIVSYQWILDCYRSNMLLCDTNYHVIQKII